MPQYRSSLAYRLRREARGLEESTYWDGKGKRAVAGVLVNAS